MDYLNQAFTSGQGTGDRVDKIIALVERLEKIEQACNSIKYNNDLLLEIPETMKLLGSAREAVIAELKMI